MLPLAVCGMAWLALSLDQHWRQLRSDQPLSRAVARRLRASGALSLLASAICCFEAEHASIAVLVWIMSATASALLVTFVLAFKPRWLSFLAR